MGDAEGIQIPSSWLDFFTISLLNPSHFEWAKSFLTSSAWNLLLKDKYFEAIITFSVPNRCPVEEELQCDKVRLSYATKQSNISEKVSQGNLTPKH
jgi:hypothetical protein